MRKQPFKIKDFAAMCRSGQPIIEAWANSPKAKIVVHRQIGINLDLYGCWILSHRKSGLCIRSYAYQFERRVDALNAAKKIENIPFWSKIGRPKHKDGKIPGWNKKEAEKAGIEVERRIFPALKAS